jgi:aminoglycoside 6-adenylyltransferase
MPSIAMLRSSVVAWARADGNVLALIATGSTSKAETCSDEFSDLDLEVIARDPKRLLDDDSWFASFGEVWVVLRLEQQHYPTRLVIYDGGSKVDFTVAGTERIEEMRDELDPLYERGYQVLLDKEATTADLPRATGAYPVRALPTQAEFDSVVEEFWFEAAHMPRYLARDDLWVVKFRDWTMKTNLLQMLEWQAVARADGKPLDVWYIGTRMKDWLDAETWQRLHEVFGGFEQRDAWRAILASADLFAHASREVAGMVGLSQPDLLERRIRSYLGSFHARFA